MAKKSGINWGILLVIFGGLWWWKNQQKSKAQAAEVPPSIPPAQPWAATIYMTGVNATTQEAPKFKIGDVANSGVGMPRLTVVGFTFDGTIPNGAYVLQDEHGTQLEWNVDRFDPSFNLAT